MPPVTGTEAGGMVRGLGVGDAVVVGLGAMIGAGVFGAFGPAAGAAGAGGALLGALGLAAVVAYCNATSSARLAARHPESGGTYVYGRERLGPFWGYLAGWSFVAGKTASCAAMALTVGHYAWPGHARALAVAAVVGLTAVNCLGVRKSAWLTRLIVALTLAVLAACVAAGLTSGHAAADRLTATGTGSSAHGLLQAAGLLFFAFAGYARIATLGEEVRDPARTIPRAIPLALGITLAVYAAVAVTLLAVLGPTVLAHSPAPLADAVRAAGVPGLAPVARAGAAVAALGSLLALLLGVSRTTLAMSRDRHLPHPLATLSAGAPVRAELAVGAAATVLAATTDLRGAIGFSSFGVLLYYAIANASALRLAPAEHRPPLVVPVVGVLGCAALGASLPAASVLAGLAVTAVGAGLYAVRRWAGGRV
ncbi:APC family permease [Streptomyces sp. NPDC049040]|uniref:APC family permease n=1 Tax=Streptomyces sp. NPDC049040 TaxID=3365593 RepID=UPI00371CD1A5